jgi:hypothetical protein
MDLHITLLERHQRIRTQRIKKKILPAIEHMYQKAVIQIYLQALPVYAFTAFFSTIHYTITFCILLPRSFRTYNSVRISCFFVTWISIGSWNQRVSPYEIFVVRDLRFSEWSEEASSLVGCYAESLRDSFVTFQRIVPPPTSMVLSP